MSFVKIIINKADFIVLSLLLIHLLRIYNDQSSLVARM
nr:MAG TPA: hypothetical protein [Caudoviricetes sp.]